MDLRGGRDIRGVPGPYGSDPEHLYGGLDLISRGHNTSRQFGVSATLGSALALRHRLQFTWSDLKSQFTSPYGPSDDRTRRVTGRYQFDRELRSVGLSGGWELLRERVDNTFITGQAFQPVPITRWDSGLFVEARPSLGRRAFLTLGARLEHLKRSALEVNPGTRPAFGEDVVWSLNPKLSAAWFLHESDGGRWTKLRASAGTGIKPPTGFEIAYTDNPSLKPERNRSVDAGIEQAIGGSSLVADATWFFNRYEDLIVAVGSTLSGASRYKTDNIANARAQGLEAGLGWTSSRGLAARMAWTWLDTEVLGVNGLAALAPKPFKVGDALIRRPRQQGFGELTWSHRHGSAFVTIGGRGRMADLEPNFTSSLYTNPGYVTAAVGGSFIVARHVEIFGRLTNALNRNYEEVFGFPALGRTGSIGVRIAASR
jgi:outer membrane receptor protein involved in Fe transport